MRTLIACALLAVAAASPALAVTGSAPAVTEKPSERLSYRFTVIQVLKDGNLSAPRSAEVDDGKEARLELTDPATGDVWQLRFRLRPTQQDQLIKISGTLRFGQRHELVQKLDFLVRSTGTIDAVSPDGTRQVLLRFSVQPLRPDVQYSTP